MTSDFSGLTFDEFMCFSLNQALPDGVTVEDVLVYISHAPGDGRPWLMIDRVVMSDGAVASVEGTFYAAYFAGESVFDDDVLMKLSDLSEDAIEDGDYDK